MVLFVTVGMPGHGKSFVAKKIREDCGAVHLNTDQIRKNVVAEGNPTYSSEESQRTYDELFNRAKVHLSEGDHVVLDGTFNKSRGRRRAEEVAKSTGSTVVFVRVECKAKTAKKRIEERDGISDADVELYEQFEVEPVQTEEGVFVVNNSGSKEETVKQVRQVLQEVL